MLFFLNVYVDIYCRYPQHKNKESEFNSVSVRGWSVSRCPSFKSVFNCPCRHPAKEWAKLDALVSWWQISMAEFMFHAYDQHQWTMNNMHDKCVRPSKNPKCRKDQKRHSPVAPFPEEACRCDLSRWLQQVVHIYTKCRIDLLQSIHEIQFVNSLREPVIQVPGAWRPMQASKPRNVAYNGLQFCRTWSLQVNERKQNNQFLDLRVRRHETNTHSTFWACSQHLVAHSHHASVNRTGDT